jgi:hypothetical protein
VAWAPYSLEARFDRLWAQGDTVAAGGGDVGAFQRAVDADTLVSGYAPPLAEFVRQSLAQAQATGRKDLTWEAAALRRAAAMAPGIPDVAAQQLNLALVSGDKQAIAAALKAAQGVAEPYPDFAAYAAAARQALSGK